MVMERLIAAVVAAFVFAAILLAAQQTLSDAQILEAIKAGEAKKFDHLVSDCRATAGFGQTMGANLAGGVQPTGGFDVVLSTNPGRIAYMAARANTKRREGTR